MVSRREFLGKTAVGVLASSAAVGAPAVGSDGDPSAKQKGLTKSRLPRIRSIVPRPESILRLGGYGNSTAMTWTANDRQLLALMEGARWSGLPKDFYFASALIEISGEPRNALFESVGGYPLMPLREFYRVNGAPLYYAGGTLAVDRHLYQLIFALRGPITVVGKDWNVGGPYGAKLIYSDDNGQTWRNQDGSTPVVRESAAEMSRKTMVFWDDEPFKNATFLQMGKAYQDNRDGYVYAYGARSNPAELVLFRVGKDRVLHRESYEYFAGLTPAGDARWTADIKGLAAVPGFASGWSCGSVVYNKPLGVYMMAAVLTRQIGEGGIRWKSSGLSFWISSTPWGPWAKTYEQDPWTPGAPDAAAISAVIAPKWISPDGASFSLVWTDLRHRNEDQITAFLERRAFRETNDEKSAQALLEYLQFVPYYRFNTQRFDVVMG